MDVEEDDEIDKDGLRINESQRDNDEKAKLVFNIYIYSEVLIGITDFVVVCYLLLLPVYYDLPTF